MNSKVISWLLCIWGLGVWELFFSPIWDFLFGFVVVVFWGKTKGKPRKCNYCREGVERVFSGRSDVLLHGQTQANPGNLSSAPRLVNFYWCSSRCTLVAWYLTIAVGYAVTSYSTTATTSFLLISPFPLLILGSFFLSSSIPPALQISAFTLPPSHSPLLWSRHLLHVVFGK